MLVTLIWEEQLCASSLYYTILIRVGGLLSKQHSLYVKEVQAFSQEIVTIVHGGREILTSAI